MLCTPRLAWSGFEPMTSTSWTQYLISLRFSSTQSSAIYKDALFIIPAARLPGRFSLYVTQIFENTLCNFSVVPAASIGFVSDLQSMSVNSHSCAAEYIICHCFCTKKRTLLQISAKHHNAALLIIHLFISRHKCCKCSYTSNSTE